MPRNSKSNSKRRKTSDDDFIETDSEGEEDLSDGSYRESDSKESYSSSSSSDEEFEPPVASRRRRSTTGRSNKKRATVAAVTPETALSKTPRQRISSGSKFGNNCQDDLPSNALFQSPVSRGRKRKAIQEESDEEDEWFDIDDESPKVSSAKVPCEVDLQESGQLVDSDEEDQSATLFSSTIQATAPNRRKSRLQGRQADFWSSNNQETNSDDDEMPSPEQIESSTFQGGTDDLDIDTNTNNIVFKSHERKREFYCCPVCYVECYRRLMNHAHPAQEEHDDEEDRHDKGDKDLDLYDFQYGPLEVLTFTSPDLCLASAFCFPTLGPLKEHLKDDHSINPCDGIAGNELFMRFSTAKADGLVQRYLKLTQEGYNTLGYMSSYFDPYHQEINTLRTFMNRSVHWRWRLRNTNVGDQKVLDFGEAIDAFFSSFRLRGHRIWKALTYAYKQDDSDAEDIVSDEEEIEGDPINYNLIDRQRVDEDGEEEEVEEFVEELRRKYHLTEGDLVDTSDEEDIVDEPIVNGNEEGSNKDNIDDDEESYHTCCENSESDRDDNLTQDFSAAAAGTRQLQRTASEDEDVSFSQSHRHRPKKDFISDDEEDDGVIDLT